MFGKPLWGQCPVLFNCHQVSCWIFTWPNIAGRWHLSWTASRSDHRWLLPCCRKAGNGRMTTESPGDSHRSGRFIWQRLEYFAWTFGLKQGPFQMGPMFSDTRSEVISGGNVFGTVRYIQCNPGQRVVPQLVMKRGFTTGIQTPSKSRYTGITSTLLHPGSSSLNVG